MLRLLAGSVLISFSAVFVKLVTVPPTTSGFYRMLFGGLGLLVITLARGERLWYGARIMRLAALAGLFFFLDLAFWHRSILRVGPGLATLLANCQVFLLALAGVLLFREPLQRRLLVAIPLAMAGLSALVAPEWQTLGPGYRTGVILGLITAAAYAAYLLTLRASRQLREPPHGMPSHFANMAIVSLSCAALLAGAALVTGESLAIPHATDALWLALYGVAAQVLGWVLISQGLPTLPAAQAGLVLLLQPTLAFTWDVLLFGRVLAPLQLTGIALAMVAIYLGSLKGPRKGPGPSK